MVRILFACITLLYLVAPAAAQLEAHDDIRHWVGFHVADLPLSNPDVPGSLGVRLVATDHWFQNKLVERFCTLQWLDGTGEKATVLKEVRYELGPRDIFVSADNLKGFVRLPTGDLLTFVYVPSMAGRRGTEEETDYGTGNWRLHWIYTWVYNHAHMTGTILGQPVDSFLRVETQFVWPAIMRGRTRDTYKPPPTPTSAPIEGAMTQGTHVDAHLNR